MRDLGVHHRQRAHMGFIDDRVMPGKAQRLVVAPAERCVNDCTESSVRCVIFILGPASIEVKSHAYIAFQVTRLRTTVIRVHRLVPGQVATYGLGVWIYEHLRVIRFAKQSRSNLLRIKAQSLSRLEGSMNTVAVELTRSNVGKVTVVDLICVLGQCDCRRLFRCQSRIKQA